MLVKNDQWTFCSRISTHVGMPSLKIQIFMSSFCVHFAFISVYLKCFFFIFTTTRRFQELKSSEHTQHIMYIISIIMILLNSTHSMRYFALKRSFCVHFALIFTMCLSIFLLIHQMIFSNNHCMDFIVAIFIIFSTNTVVQQLS